MPTSRLAKSAASLSIAGFLVFGGLASLLPTAGAQGDGLVDDTTFELDSGAEITFDAPWEFIESDLFEVEDQDMEYVLFINGDFAFIVNEFTPYSGTVEERRDQIVETTNAELIETFDQRESASATMVIDGSVVDNAIDLDEGESEWFFHTFDVDEDYRIEIRVWAPVGEMEDAFAEIENVIEIDGDAPFADVDTDEVVESFDGGSSTNNGGDETPEAGDDEYLTTVQDNYDEWSAGLERFTEILADEDLADDAVVEELNGLLDTFAAAPDVAAELKAPAEYDEIQEAYEAYADGLANINTAFEAFLDTEPDSAASAEALDDFFAAIDDATALGADLEELLSDASLNYVLVVRSA